MKLLDEKAMLSQKHLIYRLCCVIFMIVFKLLLFELHCTLI